MSEICSNCGLPKTICVCSQIARESQKIKIRVSKRRFGKLMTTISGLEDEQRAKELEKLLKKRLACGGTVRGNEIELQGDHREKVKEILLKEGYKEDLIDA
jgi:translation initiation factor 1